MEEEPWRRPVKAVEPRCAYCGALERIAGCPFRGLRVNACRMAVPISWDEYQQKRAAKRRRKES